MFDEDDLLGVLNEFTLLEEGMLYYLGIFAKHCDSPGMDDLVLSGMISGATLKFWIAENSNDLHFEAKEMLGVCVGGVERNGGDTHLFREFVITSIIAIYILGVLQKMDCEKYDIMYGVVFMSQIISITSMKTCVDHSRVWNDLYNLVYGTSSGNNGPAI